MNFDRVAHIYDDTRRLPPHVPERVRDRVIAATGANQETRFLELGVGTGRIARPFVEAEYRYTGMDISDRMLERLREKLGDSPRLDLVVGDISRLPFPDRSFDVVICVHVLHLVSAWKEILAEIRRVLAPTGSLVLGYDGSVPGEPAGAIRQQWRALVEAQGTTLRPENGSRRAVEVELIGQGAFLAEYRVARWQVEFPARQLLEEQRDRVYSATWDVPDDVLATVHEQLLDWTKDTYGDVDKPLRSAWDFSITVARWPLPAGSESS